MVKLLSVRIKRPLKLPVRSEATDISLTFGELSLLKERVGDVSDIIFGERVDEILKSQSPQLRPLILLLLMMVLQVMGFMMPACSSLRLSSPLNGSYRPSFTEASTCLLWAF